MEDNWSEDEYGVEDDLEEEEENQDGIGLRPPTATRLNEAIIKAATNRAVRNATTSAPRRPRGPTYSADTLLGPRGFRVLRERAASLVAAAAGESNAVERELDEVMRLYREWAHHMYPTFIFRDFVDKTERLCRTAPMKAYLNALRRSQATDSTTASAHPDFDEMQFVAEQNAQHALSALGREPPPPPPSSSSTSLPNDAES